MYYRDHAPPHFHAVYGDLEVTIAIDTGEVNGSFLRALPSATVREEPQILVYTFIHTETGVEVRSDHIFTRTSPDAHPSVFSLSKRSSVDSPVSVSCNGSFAGPTGAAHSWIEWLKVATRCNARP